VASEEKKITVSVDDSEESTQEKVVNIEPGKSSVEELAEQAAQQLDSHDSDSSDEKTPETDTEVNAEPEASVEASEPVEIKKTSSKIIVDEADEQDDSDDTEEAVETEETKAATDEPVVVRKNIIEPISTKPAEDPVSDATSTPEITADPQPDESMPAEQPETNSATAAYSQPTVAELAKTGEDQAAKPAEHENARIAKPVPQKNYKIDPKKLKKGPKNVSAQKSFPLGKTLVLVVVLCAIAGAYYAYTQL